jgi:hypothetical protein
MTIESNLHPKEYEETIISIMRRLPSERLLALIEFARFLEFQAEQAASASDDKEIEKADGDAKWDELLTRPKAKLLLREMAEEARAEYGRGETTEIGLTYERMLK